jgi:hypothetical protein
VGFMENDNKNVPLATSEASQFGQELIHSSAEPSQGQTRARKSKTPKVVVYSIIGAVIFVFSAVALWFHQKRVDNRQGASTPSLTASPLEPSTTIAIKSNSPTGVKVLENGWYIISNGSVYFMEINDESLVSEADASSFEYIESVDGVFSGFFKDKNYVYYVFEGKGKKSIENSDSSTFHFLNYHFAKDKNQAYFETWAMGGNVLYVLDDVDVDTFKVIDNNIAKDANNVYFAQWDGVRLIEGADANTIVDLGSSFVGDKKSVFYGDYSIEDLDLTTVQVLGSSYIKDDKKVYYCEGFQSYSCMLVEHADSESFQLIKDGEYEYANGYVAKDRYFLYNRGLAIENSDPETFVIIKGLVKEQNYNARDKNNLYNMWCDMDGCSLGIVQEK